jgi:hypothetical protein
MGLVAIISPHEWRIEQKGDGKFLSERRLIPPARRGSPVSACAKPLVALDRKAANHQLSNEINEQSRGGQFPDSCCLKVAMLK